MFNAKGRLKHYMQEKSREVFVKTDILLYSPHEYDWVHSLSSKETAQIIKDLNAAILCDVNITDSHTCPQCNHYRGDCDDCAYGALHNICGGYDPNTYDMICSKVQLRCITPSIIMAIGEDVIKQLIKWM